MFIPKGSFPARVVPNFKGGEGSFHIEDILSTEQMGKAGRLFAWGTLEPGSSVGWHEHHGDMEICCCVSGEGIAVDADGSENPFRPGDVNIAADGEGHAIRNTGSESLTYLAVVIFPAGQQS